MHSNNNITLQTYEENFQLYITDTPHIIPWELKTYIDRVLSFFDKNAVILELGSSFWRDADYIESQWYEVQRSDAVQWFIDYNVALGKKCDYINLLSFSLQENTYDLIFANAVLLHFSSDQFRDIINKFIIWLKKRWIIAFTLQSWIWEKWSSHRMAAPRYFKYWSREELYVLFDSLNIKIKYLEITQDWKRIQWIIQKI